MEQEGSTEWRGTRGKFRKKIILLKRGEEEGIVRGEKKEGGEKSKKAALV